MKVRMGVASKLAVAVSLFIVPVIVLLVLLYNSQQIAIDFGDKEKVGNDYLTALRPVQVALVDTNARIDVGALKAAIAKAEADFGPDMGSADQAKAAEDSLDGKDPRDTTALRALINQVGNNSNLILDPDLDSYYVMDLVLLKLPELIDSVHKTAQYADGKTGTDKIEMKDMATFLQLIGSLQFTLDGAKGSLASAYDGNKNGNPPRDLGDRIDPSAQAMFAAIGKLIDAFNASTLAGGNAPLKAGGFTDLETAARKATVEFSDQAGTAMNILFDRRIHNFWTDRYETFGLAILLSLLAFGVVLAAIRWTVIRPIGSLTESMRKLAADDTSVEVKAQDRRDELGEMARAVGHFKLGIVERLDL
ncbi:MAG: HAMP domain-containing protein, partial [Dongia sp.]